MKSVTSVIRSDQGFKAPKIAYVLSGGAAKGFCHLGMMEALEESGTMPDLIVGTSAGALFGSLYAHFRSVSGVYERIEDVLSSAEFKEFEKKYFAEKQPVGDGLEGKMKKFLSDLGGTLKNGMHLGRALITSAMISEKDAFSIFGRIFAGITFETLKIPFAAVSVNLTDGACAVFGGGLPGLHPLPGPEGLMKAVMASSAIPFVFPAVAINDCSHADGFILANLPAREALAILGDEPAFLAGFDVSAPIEETDEDLSNVELALRLLDLATRSKQSADRQLVDVLFQPIDKKYAWSSFSKYRELVTQGRRYMDAERLAAFDAAYVDRCRKLIGEEKSPFRRFSTARRLKRHSAGLPA